MGGASGPDLSRDIHQAAPLQVVDLLCDQCCGADDPVRVGGLVAGASGTSLPRGGPAAGSPRTEPERPPPGATAPRQSLPRSAHPEHPPRTNGGQAHSDSLPHREHDQGDQPEHSKRYGYHSTLLSVPIPGGWKENFFPWMTGYHILQKIAMVFSLFSVNNFRIGGAPPFRSIKYLPKAKNPIYCFLPISLDA